MNNETAASFGLFSYTNTDNLGDEIQSLAARRFLPRVDCHVDREQMNAFVSRSGKPVWMIMNGWFCHYPERWPPSRYIVPLITSMHINPYNSYSMGLLTTEAMLSEPAVKYLRGFGPIGARDLHTLDLLRRANVESYFSGCLTLTLERPDIGRDENLIVACDVPRSVADLIGVEAPQKRLQQVRHGGFNNNSSEHRFNLAEKLLELYAVASCVVTTRLHCALPCTALGTPVFLLDTAPDQNRFAGLHDLVRHGSLEDFVNRKAEFDLNRPAPNPPKHLKIREELISRATAFVARAVEGCAPPAFPLSSDELYQIQSRTLSQIGIKVQEDRDRLARLEKSVSRLVSGAN